MLAIDYSTVRLLIRLLLGNDGEMCRPVLARFDATDCKIRNPPRPREWNRSAMGSGEEADPDMQSVSVSTIAMSAELDHSCVDISRHVRIWDSPPRFCHDIVLNPARNILPLHNTFCIV